ncbi:MAG: ATPase P [Gemmatimonadales bacterium]
MAAAIVVPVPGGVSLELTELVLDFNGTLALDGHLLPGVEPLLRSLAGLVRIHVLTADTHCNSASALAGLPVTLHLIRDGADKQAYVEALGSAGVVAVGNGRNDVAMLRVAGLGMVVVGPEGAAGEAIAAARVVVADISTALELLRQPLRLTATLRA